MKVPLKGGLVGKHQHIIGQPKRPKIGAMQKRFRAHGKQLRKLGHRKG